jgi:hypothetical protein
MSKRKCCGEFFWQRATKNLEGFVNGIPLISWEFVHKLRRAARERGLVLGLRMAQLDAGGA